MTTKEAIVLLIDCGTNMKVECSNDGKTYIDQVRHCLQWIAQRKVFNDSKDHIGVILLGSDTTNNSLQTPDEYRNITVLRPISNEKILDIVKYAKEELKATKHEADFVEGIIVAADALRTATSDKMTGHHKFTGRSIHVMSNLAVKTKFNNLDHLQAIKQSLRDENIQLNFIGIDPYDDETLEPTCDAPDDLCDDSALASKQCLSTGGVKERTKVQEANLEVVRNFFECDNAVEGLCHDINDAAALLNSYSRRQVRATPWKCVLEIGKILKIPLNIYIKVKEHKLSRQWIKTDATGAGTVNRDIIYERAENSGMTSVIAKLENDNVKSEPDVNDDQALGSTVTTAVQSQQNEEAEQKPSIKTETDVTVSKENLIRGFRFGTTIQPFTKEQLDALKYQSEGKCFQLITFIKNSEILPQYYTGDSTRIALPDIDDDSAISAVSSLVRALLDLDRSALVRYCYNKTSSPKILLLKPYLNALMQCPMFICLQMPFSEDMRNFLFPQTIETINISDDKLHMIDTLIDAMPLVVKELNPTTNSMHTVEHLSPYSLQNPTLQYTYTRLAHKLLAEQTPEPKPEDESSLKPLLHLASDIEAVAKPLFAKIATDFKLERIEKRKRKGDENDATANGLQDEKRPRVAPATDQQVLTIGSTDPIADFNFWLATEPNQLPRAVQMLTQRIIEFVRLPFMVASATFAPSPWEEKAMKCLKAFRATCLQNNQPGTYNSFIVGELRSTLVDNAPDGSRLTKLWRHMMLRDSVVDLWPISDEECEGAMMSKDDARHLVQIEEQQEVDNDNTQTVNNDDIDDLI